MAVVYTHKHKPTHTVTTTICLSRPISVAFTWLDRLCERSSVSKWVQWIFARPCLCNCVCTRLCLCARLRWLIPLSGETGPDGPWWLAVFVATELMMLFMKFIDPICISPRVPIPISLSVFLPLGKGSPFCPWPHSVYRSFASPTSPKHIIPKMDSELQTECFPLTCPATVKTNLGQVCHLSG